jgi:hypothetical protein
MGVYKFKRWDEVWAWNDIYHWHELYNKWYKFYYIKKQKIWHKLIQEFHWRSSIAVHINCYKLIHVIDLPEFC